MPPILKLMKALGLKTDEMVKVADPAAVEVITSKLARKGAKPTEQEVYQEIARINAAMSPKVGGLGLPVRNTPMERAKKQNYVDSYHGTQTPEGIERKGFLIGGDTGSIRSGDAYGTGVYTSTSPDDASSYAKGVGAVFPLMLNRSKHLSVNNPTPLDLEKLSSLASKQMLPSDKARFATGKEKREFQSVEDARDFFDSQRENWKQFGGGYDRARPEAIANPDGTFAVEFTNFDADIPISSGDEADTLLRALGYDNVQDMGYSGHTLQRSAGRQWDITSDVSKLRSRFAAFDPARIGENNLLASRLLPFALPGLLAIPQEEE